MELGRKIEKPTPPAPGAKQIRPGVMQGADGKLYTTTPRCTSPAVCNFMGSVCPCERCKA